MVFIGSSCILQVNSGINKARNMRVSNTGTVGNGKTEEGVHRIKDNHNASNVNMPVVTYVSLQRVF